MGNKITISGIYKDRPKSTLSHWKAFYQTLPYLWPKDNVRLRIELLLSLICMIAAATSELYAPVPIKRIIADMTTMTTKHSNLSFSSDIVKNFILYGFVYAATKIFPQLRDFFFSGIDAETERTVSMKTFRHLQRLSLSFHIRRETGGILTSIARGTKTSSALLKSTLFTVVPMFIKLIGIVMIFAFLYDWYYFIATSLAIVTYFTCTLIATRWRDKHLQIVNEKQNEKNSRMLGEWDFL